MDSIYFPAEDSFFLSEFIKKEIENSKSKNLNVLDMGSGSGIQAQTTIDSGIPQEKITLIDINKNSIKKLRKKFPSSEVIYSNLFNRLPNEKKFDLIIFNPPYLPENKYDKEIDTTGGEKGSEIINEFLIQAKNYLNEKGKIFLLTSSLTKDLNFDNYKKKLLGSKKLFFEELFVWQLSNKIRH